MKITSEKKELDALLADMRITTFGRLVESHELLYELLGRDLERQIGIPLRWYGVLLHVGRSEAGVRPMSELVNATAFTSGGVTRLVDRMEQAGLVERRPCPTDRRVQYVALTEQGQQILEQGTAVHVEGIQRYLIDLLSAEEIDALDAILERLLVAHRERRPEEIG